jgi:hypothetical protein
MNELLPCPFCGNPDIEGENTVTEYTIFCWRCLAKMSKKHKGKESDNLAIKAVITCWNTRSSPPTPQKDEVGDKERLLRDFSIFVSSIQGGLYGLSTHPSDTPLNGCLISKPSMEKLNYIYNQVIKERQRLDAAIAAERGAK